VTLRPHSCEKIVEHVYLCNISSLLKIFETSMRHLTTATSPMFFGPAAAVDKIYRRTGADTMKPDLV